MVLAPSTVKRVEELVTRAQAAGRAPALIAGVIRDGALAYVTGAGEHPASDRDTQFRIGSITKSFTAALVLGLRDEEKLQLDDALGTYLPGLPDGVGAVPLRRLLSHVGGLQREPEGPWWERSPGGSLAHLVTGVTAEKLTARPYGEFHYSNLAYGLLGGVVERVSGQPYPAALTTRLLDPLGLRRTTYHPQEPFARGYVVHPWHGTLSEEPRHDAGAMAPAGQLWSTVEDLARWAAALCAVPSGGALNTGTVVAPASASEMATPVVIADPQWSAGYGLGLHMWRRGERVFCGHTGSMPGYLAVLCVHRPTRTGAVAFANTYRLTGTTIGELGLSIVEAVLDDEPAPPAAPWRPLSPPADPVAALCGRWWWMGRELEIGWDATSGHLVLRLPGGIDDDEDDSRFTAAGEDRWLGVSGDDAGEILTVRRDDSGAVVALDISTYEFTREP